MENAKKTQTPAILGHKKNRISYSLSDKAFILVDVIILFIFFVIIVYPLLYVVASSFSAGKVLSGLSLIPEHVSLDGYTSVFEYPYTWGSIWNSVVYTVLGTAIAMIVTVLCAYALAQNFGFGKFCMTLCLITMYFGGGLIPTYICMKNLGLLNSMWAILLPSALSIYNMIVMRTYFRTQIPQELHESAQIDGCGEWRYMFQIVLPLSGAVLAVITLYYAVGRWNAYFDSMIYLQKKELLPLQNIMRELLIVGNTENMTSDMKSEAIAQQRAELLKYSLIVISSLPMMILYPFVQKYFVKGVMLGSVKG